jgi:hypothetical protein
MSGEDGGPRRLVRAQARAVPSGGVPESSTPAPTRGSPGRQAGTSGTSLALWRLSAVRRQTPQDHQEPTTYPAAPLPRGGGTGLVPVPRGATRRSRVGAGASREERPELREPGAPARAQQARGAAGAASPWQPLLEEAGDKCFDGQRQPFPSGAGAFFKAQCDVASFEHFQAVVGQGHPGDIGREGGEALRASPGGLAMGPPLRVPDWGRHGITEASSGHRRFALAPEASGERAARDKPGRRAGRAPRRTFWGQPTPGPEGLDMGMLGPSPRPGVEHPAHADLPAEGARSPGQSLQGSRGGLKKQGIQAALRRTGHGAACLGESERNKKGRDRQEQRQLLVEPAGRRGILTLWALPILTGMRALRQFPTVGTLLERPPQRLSAALCTGRHGRQVAGQQPVFVLRAVRRSIAPEEIGQRDHRGPPAPLRGHSSGLLGPPGPWRRRCWSGACRGPSWLGSRVLKSPG